MKAIALVRTSVLTMTLLTACNAPRDEVPQLEPQDKRPVYRTQVSDATEAELLHQQVGIEVKSLVMNDLLFYSRHDSIMQKLTALGYKVDTPDLRQVYFQVVRVEGGNEKDLSQYGVHLINREKGYGIVRGSLDALTKLRGAGFKLVTLPEEVRPREVTITGGDQSDIQRMYELGVDIFTAAQDSSGIITVRGSAFDFQIDSLRNMKLEVKVIKERI